MRKLFRLLSYVILSILVMRGYGKAQKTCPFPINKHSILTNENIDTFFRLFKTDSFIVRSKKRYIPGFIKKELKCLSNSNFKLANPGKRYNESDFLLWNLPMRQLVFFAKSKSAIVIQYKRGGFASSNNLVCILHNGKQILDLWKGTVNVVVDFTSLAEIRFYMDEMKKNNIPFFNPDIYF